jgi:uncharacterized membrane protein YbhN (UPF0104 family)
MSSLATSVDVSATDPLAALSRLGASRKSGPVRKAAPFAAVLVAGVFAALFAPGVIEKFGDALVGAIHADPRWVVAGVVFELLSFVGYIALFWHVAGRSAPRIGLRESYEVSLAGAAVTRLLPTAGAGGAALTFWSLRRAGHESGAAARTFLTFLVVLYAVFLGAILVAGALLASGSVSGDVPLKLSAVPAAGAGIAMALGLSFAIRHGRGRTGAGEGRMSGVSHAVGGAVNEARVLFRSPDARLLGAPAWWAFDLMVLWATFNAFGHPPEPTVLVLGYFLGQVANTIPLPGAASGGMVGSFLALGLPAEVVLPAVLAYRAIAIWTPVPAGAAALTGLRSTVKRWAVEDAGEQPAEKASTGLLRGLPVPSFAGRVPSPAAAGVPSIVALAEAGQRAPPNAWRCPSGSALGVG